MRSDTTNDGQNLALESEPDEWKSHPKQSKKDMISTNQPHPSLEYPPLYFAFENSPRILEGIKKFYSWRWQLSYPLQKRVPCSRILHFLRIHLTYGEAFILLPLASLAVICLVKSLIHPDVTVTGKISRFGVFSALLFGQKNSFITMVLGIPFDRALFFHMLSGHIALVAGFLHGLAYYVDSQTYSENPRKTISSFFKGSMNASGSMLLIFLIVLFLTSLQCVRSRLFELFYFVHLICLLGIGGCASFHTGPMVPLFVFSTSMADFVIRKVYMAHYRYPKKANLRVLSDTVVEIRFKKICGFDYNPGQYLYIMIPDISMFQWHPFSFCSSPHEPEVVLYVRVAGNWTASLHALAKKKTEMTVALEGPYGNFGIDVANKERYKTVMFVGGGIGLTPLQSLCSHLLKEYQSGERQMKKLKFIWIERDPQLVAQANIFDVVKDPSPNDPNIESGCMTDQHSSLALKLFSSIPPGQETDEQLEDLFESFDLELEYSQSDINSDEETNTTGTSHFSENQSVQQQDSNSTEVNDWAPFTIEKPIESQNIQQQGINFTEVNDWERFTMGKQIEKTGTIWISSKEVCEIQHKSGRLGAASYGFKKDISADLSPTKTDISSEFSSPVCGEKSHPNFNSSPNEENDDGISHNFYPSQNFDLSQLNSIDLGDGEDEDVLDVDIYLTSPKLAKTLDMNWSLPSAVQVGRPDLPSCFLDMRQEAIKLGESRVAVCVCGPRRITALCQKACMQLSDSKVQFDCHVESFGG